MSKKKTYEYNSIFKEDINNLIKEKELLLKNNTIRRYNEVLKIFDLWCIENNVIINDLNEELIEKWMTQRNTENSLTRHLRCSITRELARNMIKNKKNAYVIPSKYYKGINEHIPYIYSDEEIINLLTYFENIKEDPQYRYRKETYSLVFKLLIFTGARKSEILSLKVSDIDFENNKISIIQGKEYIDRDIPLDDDITKELLRYRELLSPYGDDSSYFFSNIDVYKGKRRKVSNGALKTIFRKALETCNIEYKGIKEGPRIHDFRFTFVVKSIKKLVSENKDLNVYLPILIKYLGHANLSDTLYYFRPTDTIFDENNYKNNTLIPKLNEGDFYEE